MLYKCNLFNLVSAVVAPGLFLMGVLGGRGGGGGLIKLRESNERLNFSYQIFYIQQLRKRHIVLFCGIKPLICNVKSNVVWEKTTT